MTTKECLEMFDHGDDVGAQGTEIEVWIKETTELIRKDSLIFAEATLRKRLALLLGILANSAEVQVAVLRMAIKLALQLEPNCGGHIRSWMIDAIEKGEVKLDSEEG